jgi:hypothetical protein
MNLRKFLKWSLILMAIVAYKRLEANDGQHDYSKPANAIVIQAES